MYDAKDVAVLLALATQNRWPAPFRRVSGDLAPVAAALEAAAVSEREIQNAGQTIASLVIGGAAERAFEKIYSNEMETSDVELVDDRAKRTDADYILRNGSQRDIYRINIKLHGSLFRKAQELVGLDPLDCFPLATYKINLALQKQNRHHLPFIFVIVTSPSLASATVANRMPQKYAYALAAARKIFKADKRKTEESLVSVLVENEVELYQWIVNELEGGSWHVVSARRAHNLMKEFLFERVFALTTRNFTRAFRNAEIDMHLSFSRDMIPVQEFLRRTKELSLSVIASQIERGTL